MPECTTVRHGSQAVILPQILRAAAMRREAASQLASLRASQYGHKLSVTLLHTHLFYRRFIGEAEVRDFAAAVLIQFGIEIGE